MRRMDNNERDKQWAQRKVCAPVKHLVRLLKEGTVL